MILVVRPIARKRIRVLGRFVFRKLIPIGWRSVVSTGIIADIVRQLRRHRERRSAHLWWRSAAAVHSRRTRPGMVRRIHNRSRSVKLTRFHIVLFIGSSSCAPIPDDKHDKDQKEYQHHQAPNGNRDTRRFGYAASTRLLGRRRVSRTHVPAKPTGRNARDSPC